MLAAHEYSVGTLAEARPGTLVLPRTRYESTFIVGERADRAIAMFLDGDHIYKSFPSAEGESWKGLLISEIELVVDPASLFDPDNEQAPFGAVVRGGKYLSVIAKSGDRYGFHDAIRISLHGDLTAMASNLKVGFLHWQLVLGSGQDRRVLFEIDLRTASSTK